MISQVLFNDGICFKEKLIIKVNERDEEGEVVNEAYSQFHLNIEIAKRNYYHHEKLDKLEKYLVLLLITNTNDLLEIAKGDEILEVTVEDIIRYSQGEELMEAYEAEIERGRYQIALEYYAEKNGMEKGMEKGIRKSAKAMLDKGIDIKIISEITELPLGSIQKLRKEN